MELNNLNTEHQSTTTFWEDLHFEGKEYVYFKENVLFLKETSFSKERFLKKINPQDAASVVEALIQNFENIKKSIDVLEDEWNNQEEKIKLDAKVDQLIKEISTIAAIGNFNDLFTNLADKKKIIDAIYEGHYQERKNILQKAEAFIEDERNNKDEVIQFKDILEEWKQAPDLRKNQYEQLSAQMNLIKDKYFERRRQFKEERDLEQMHHLDLKMQICEEAEAIMNSENWKKTTDQFHELFERWKKIGMVTSQEKNEEMWERFNNARNIFYTNRKSYFDAINQEQQQNLLLKMALVEKAEAIQNQTTWKETAEEFANISEEWNKIGKVPYDKMDEVWSRLQKARDVFFQARRESAVEFKKRLQENYDRKKELAEKADSIKNSKDWHGTTLELNQLMDEWKSIGAIPRENGNEVWEAFINARNHFFKRKDADREERKEKFKKQLSSKLEQTENFLKTLEEELIDEQEKLKEFSESLERIQGNHPKEEELKIHLKDLLENINRKIPSKIQKIEEVKKQHAELIKRNEEINPSSKEI